MKECIILAPGARGTELIKSLAMHGVNSFNLRICSAVELARISLMRSGVSVTQDFVSRREETAELKLGHLALDGRHFRRGLAFGSGFGGLWTLATVDGFLCGGLPPLLNHLGIAHHLDARAVC